MKTKLLIPLLALICAQAFGATMSITNVLIGTQNSGTGDVAFVAFNKLNTNDVYLERWLTGFTNGSPVLGDITNGTRIVGKLNATTNVGIGGWLTLTNGFFVLSNAVASWPTAPEVAGQCFLGNSNGVLFLLTSGVGATWTATNKLGP